jgi:pantoate--beta-alanine ligase
VSALRLATSAGQLAQWLAPGRRTVVMTMGALHQGHLDLVRAGASRGGQLIVTVFVNPLQFGPAEDFERYPRDLEADLRLLEPLGVDLVYAPTREDMYPDGSAGVSVDPGKLGDVFEGAVRPGHFRGVLTVVHKLARRTGAEVAVFGQKDAQQLACVRAMNRDLDLGLDIVAVPTRRDADGLALSSRNAYLTPGQRRAALALPRAIAAGARVAAKGASAIRAAAQQAAVQAPADDVSAQHNPAQPTAARMEYLELVDPSDFTPVPADWSGEALLIGAAQVGATRLIDNAPLDVGAASLAASPTLGE